MIKSVVFDLGGVLVRDAKEEIKKEVAGFLGVGRQDLDARTQDLSMRVKRGELALRDFYEMAMARLEVTGRAPEEVVEKHLEIYRRHSSLEDSEILGLVERLKSGGYVVASATNTEREIYQLSSRKGYFEIFNPNFVSVEMGMAKPQYQFFGRMLDELDTSPRDTVFIDDSPYCIQRACEVGINGLVYENFTKLGIDLQNLGVKVD